MAKEKKAIVLGSGLAGLSAAWRLAKDGYLVDIVEIKSYPGGMSASLKRNGFIFDHGPHGYNISNEAFYNFFKQIMDNEEYVIRSKDIRIKFQNKLYRYPLKAADLLVKLNPFISIECFLSYLYTVTKNKIFPPKNLSAEEWIINNFGKKLYDIYFGPYTKKVWGIEPNKLSPNFARLRIPKMNLLNILAKSLLSTKFLATKKDFRYAPIILKFAYPERGAGRFSEILVEHLKRRGTNLFLSAKAEKIDFCNGNVKVTVRNEGNTKELQVDVLISTVPIIDIIGALTHVNREVVKAAKFFQYRSAIILCIIANKDKIFTPETLYFSNRFFTRVSDLKNYGIKGYPDGLTGLMCEIPCNLNDEIWQAEDKYLLEKAISDLEEEDIISLKNVQDYFTIKLSHAYPVYTIGYETNLEIIKEYLRTINNVYFTGRQSQFRYVDMDNAVLSGIKTAEFILSGFSKEESAGLTNKEEYFY